MKFSKMLSKNTIKYITSLQLKKYRDKENVFIVEGEKMVLEALTSSFKTQLIVGVQETIDTLKIDHVNLQLADTSDMKKVSSLSSFSSVLAIVQKPDDSFAEKPEYILALDNVQDPGNVGTLLRTCNWFGISNVLLSEGCADTYNSKVVQATMGAIFHIATRRCQLSEELNTWKNKGYSISGTFLDGENIYEQQLKGNTIIVAGNEGKGIGTDIESLVDKKLHIPFFGNEQSQESLNVSVATAIVLSEFMRGKKL